MTYALNFFLTLTISFVFFSFLLKISSRIKQFQDQGVSVLGGTGILFSGTLFLAYIHFYRSPLPPELLNICLFASIIFFVGLLDDIRELSLLLKLIIQIVVFALFLLTAKGVHIYFLPGYLNYLISFLWLVGITNAFNLLDINDGLCSGVSLLTGLSFAIAAFLCNDIIITHLFICISATLFAFYVLNVPPARMYLGNSGSHFLGFLFASLSMHIDYTAIARTYTVLIPLLFLAFPILDTFFLIFARAKRGILPLHKSNDHIFMRLTKKGIRYHRALLIIYMVTINWCATGIFMLLGKEIAAICCLIIAGILTLLTIKKARR
ncbi:MAG: undecaprenyl/decaprenyl-phosphate alpha-N-acetylglucosaminyl 1-phosphate transferase [Candidatus Omnitrophica bacterium]|nr:undecaprenyl/decaprenyl-phosphate alpha-N-acetylglucosaminyl 1-phosphate transferase [Candidatus Omnitrophota bacterium]